MPLLSEKTSLKARFTRTAISILVLLLVLTGLRYWIENFSLKNHIETTIERKLGLDITIGDIEFRVLANRIEVRNLHIHNPPGYEMEDLAYIPKIVLALDGEKSFRAGQLRFQFVQIEVEALYAIVNAEGELNLKALPLIGQLDNEKKPELLIDYFSLSLGGVYYINYQKSAKAQLKRYPINLEPTTFKNVDSFEDIVNVVIAQLYANQSLNKRFGNMISQSTRALKGITQAIKTPAKKN